MFDLYKFLFRNWVISTCSIVVQSRKFYTQELGRENVGDGVVHQYEECYYGVLHNYISYFLHYLYIIAEIHRRGMSMQPNASSR
jgi:hypothetical protein